MLVLHVIQGPDKGRRFELPDHEPQMIGRSSEALPLTDQTISRRHASLTPDEGQWYINDLQSSNGTFVNGVRVTDRRLLKPGDQVRTGMTLMVYGDPQKRSGNLGQVKVLGRGEIDVSLEHTVEARDDALSSAMGSAMDSMILSAPAPEQSAVFQLRVIYELIALIGSVTQRTELYDRVMDVVFGYFQADRGFILIQDDPEDRPEPVVVRHRIGGRVSANRDNKQGPIPVSRTIVKYVMTKGVGVLSSNAMSDKRFAAGDSVHNLGIRSAMCVPIKFKDRIYGVIYVDSKIANYTYTEDQLTLLTAIGVQTGLALANMRAADARIQSERLAAVGQTVASLSHSIKNIVQGLRGGAEVVELGMRKDNINVVKGGWDIVSRNLERVSELVMNMLAYSKQRSPEFDMINVVQLLEDIIELQEKQFETKKAALLTDIDPDIPPVPIDGGAIHQAVLNLINNALDAVDPESGVVTLGCQYHLASTEPVTRRDTPGNTPDKPYANANANANADADITVRADPLNTRERLTIMVADNGMGMSKSVQASLFQPFHSTKGYGGTGLGLVVTKKIVDEHGGRIDVESSEGQGTIFTITLPAWQRDSAASADTHGPATRKPAASA